MTALYCIYGDDGITAIELYCGDDVKYCEHFGDWQHLMSELSEYMSGYVRIVVTSIGGWKQIHSIHTMILEAN